MKDSGDILNIIHKMYGKTSHTKTYIVSEKENPYEFPLKLFSKTLSLIDMMKLFVFS